MITDEFSIYVVPFFLNKHIPDGVYFTVFGICKILVVSFSPGSLGLLNRR